MATDVFWRNDLLVFDGNDRVLLGTTTQTTVVPVPNTSWTWKDAPVVSYKKNGGSLPAFPTFLPEGFPETAWSTDPRSESQPDSWVEDIRCSLFNVETLLSDCLVLLGYVGIRMCWSQRRRGTKTVLGAV